MVAGVLYQPLYLIFCRPCKITERKKIVGSKIIDPCGGRLTIS